LTTLGLVNTQKQTNNHLAIH